MMVNPPSGTTTESLMGGLTRLRLISFLLSIAITSSLPKVDERVKILILISHVL